MSEERLARLERDFAALEAEWAALEHAITSMALFLGEMDMHNAENLHRRLLDFAVVERQRGGDGAERRSAAVEVLAARLLLEAQRAHPAKGRA